MDGVKTKDREYFTEPSHNKYVPATTTQITHAKKFRFLVELNRDETSDYNCKHEVFYDVGQFMYTYRYCLACDHLLEMI